MAQGAIKNSLNITLDLFIYGSGIYPAIYHYAFYNCSLQNIMDNQFRAEGNESKTRRFLLNKSETTSCTTSLGEYLSI